MKNFNEFSKGIKINESEMRFLNESEQELEDLGGSIITHLEDNDIDASYETEDGCLCIEVGGDKYEIKKDGSKFTQTNNGKSENFSTEDKLISWWSQFVGSHKAAEADYKMSESSTNKKPKMEDFEFPNDLTGEKAYNAYRKAKKEWREKREKEKGSKISENRNPPKKKDSFEDEINSAELKLEHLADQDFIKSICNGEVRYDIDNQEGNDKESWDVWIEFENVKPEALEELDKDYNKFAAPFVKWAKENDLYNPSILSTDDTISFKITLL